MIIKKLFRNRNALSKLVITIIVVSSIIVVLLSAFLGVYFTILRDENPPPLKSKFYINIVATSISDSNKDSQFDQFTFTLNNNYSSILTLYNATIRITVSENLSDSTSWSVYNNWHLPSFENIILNPSENKEISLDGNDQIELSVFKEYYCSVLFYNDTNSGTNQIISNWFLLNNYVSLSDLIISFEMFNLTDWGYDGAIDDPGRAASSYMTNADGDYQLQEESNNNLLVLDESELIPFYLDSEIIVLHSINGILSTRPLKQAFELSLPIRAQKCFMLGLAGSWGDNFVLSDWALNLTFVYTDDSFDNYLLNHSYIDDWWYSANPGGICLSAPTGAVTEIDLGTQVDTPHSHIHTHTTRFYFDYFKYLKQIIFEDPGTDQSASHILAITFS